MLGGTTMNNIISSNSNRIFTTQNSLTINQSNNSNESQKSNNNLITSLQKNIEQLKEEKKALKDQNLDPKDLLEKKEKIDEQINELNSQIQQAILQQKEADAEKSKEDIQKQKLEESKYTKNGDEIRDGVIISSTLNTLIEANRSKKVYDNLKELKARYQYSDPGIAKNINNVILKELGKTNKSIEKDQDLIEEENKKPLNTIDTDEKTKKEKNTDNTASENLNTIQESKDEKRKYK